MTGVTAMVTRRLQAVHPQYSARYVEAEDFSTDDEITVLWSNVPTRWAIQVGAGYFGVNEYGFEDGVLEWSQCHGLCSSLDAAVERLVECLRKEQVT